jgi:calcineurin-like phosphoesterase family protein
MSIRRPPRFGVPHRSSLLALVLSGAVLLSCEEQTTPSEPVVALQSSPAVASASTVTLVGAGDVASCSSSEDEATAKLLDNIPGTVFTAGDNAYADGSAAQYASCYGPTWGRHKARTRPSPGNHEYHTAGAADYFGYFGAAAGDAGKGYYSFDLGTWHIVSLNSNISMSAGSVQEKWLRADLASSTARCTIAYWHHPRFSSGTKHGSFSGAQPIWQALYDYDAEVVISGHEHNYERFAPQTPAGVKDDARGIREFVVGTGGVGHYAGNSRIANSEVFNGSASGVLKLTLADGSYLWEFVPIAGQSFTDRGTGDCHGSGSGPAPTPPDSTPPDSTPPDSTVPDTTSPADTTTPPPPSGNVAPGRATRLVLTPADTVQVGPVGATQKLLGRAFNGATEVATPIKWWVSSSGSIAGLSSTECTSPCYVTVTGKTLGKAKVVVHEYVSGSTATWDTTWVKVTSTATPGGPVPPAPTLSRVVVVPVSAALNGGQSAQFAAYGRMTNGDSVPVSVAWSATGGTISSAGLYTAGAAGGSFGVIGASSGMADTSTVAVTIPTTLPPQEPPPQEPPPVTPAGPFLGPEVASRPTSGTAWSAVLAQANATWAAPDLCNINNKTDVQALAGALVYARTGDAAYRTKVIRTLQAAVATQRDGCSSGVLSLGRQLGGYVLAADYAGYRDAAFVQWVSQIRTREIGGHGRWHQLRFTAGNSSNNWGIWALASSIAADRYLGDATALAKDWAIFKGYGDGTWTGFKPTADYLAGWNCGRYRAIEDLHCGNPDHNGAPVEDASRSGNTTLPHLGYINEALSGLTVQAMLLEHAGYPAWTVNASQMRRVADFLVRTGAWNAESVGYFAAWVINAEYGANYPAKAGNGGRMFGFADWLYGP